MPARVLWVTGVPPDHDGTGGQLRQAALLDVVATRSPVVLVTAGELRDPRVRATVEDVVEVPVADPDPPGGRHRLQLLRHHVTARVPWEVARAATVRAALADALAGLVRADDVAVVEHLELAPLAAELAVARRRVLTIHHAAGRQARQQAALATTRRQRSWWTQEARRAAALERQAGASVDAVVSVSDLDAEALACPSVVVPNPVAFDRAPSPAPGRRRVLFTGLLDYGPNVDGITWFVDRVWPQVRAELPDALLQVVGRAPVPAVAALASRPGIDVHADVASIGPWFEGADVTVVPLRLGGGTRLKALQALAAGRPVVGTSIGLEGLGLRHGEHAVVADDPADLAAGVIELLRDPERAGTLAAAGRAHVARTHSPEAAGARLLDVLELHGGDE